MCFSRYRRSSSTSERADCCFIRFTDLDDRDYGGLNQKRKRIGHGSSRLTRILPTDDDTIGFQRFDTIRHNQKWSPRPQQRFGNIWPSIAIVRLAARGYDDQIGASGFPNKPCGRRFDAVSPLDSQTSLFRNASKPALPGGEQELHLFDLRLAAGIDHDPVGDKGRPDAKRAEAGDCGSIARGYVGGHMDKIGLFAIGFRRKRARFQAT